MFTNVRKKVDFPRVPRVSKGFPLIFQGFPPLVFANFQHVYKLVESKESSVKATVEFVKSSVESTESSVESKENLKSEHKTDS